MSEQVFVSYRRTGGDVSAKLIAEALKNQGFTVFYDFDSLHGGYFDTRIIDAIEGCDDFVLVLPENGLDRCVNDDDWVRQEIRAAAKNNKNIIPISLPNFVFPNNLPDDIAFVSRINAVPFSMPFFDAMIKTVVDRMRACPLTDKGIDDESFEASELDKFSFDANLDGTYTVKYLANNDETVTIPSEYNGKPVTRIGSQAFKGVKILKEVRIPNTIVEIGDEAFAECTSLVAVTMSKKMQKIGNCAFKNCKKLQSVLLPNSVTDLGDEAFNECESLVGVKLSASIKVIGDNTFRRCTSLREIVIPSGVRSIGAHAFGACTALERIVIPGGVSTIGKYAFNSCTSLREINLPNTLEKISDGMLRGCDKLESVEIPARVTEIEMHAFNGCKVLARVSIPEGLKKIGNSAFSGCVALTGISLGESLEVIDAYAFSGCKSMKWVAIPSSITDIEMKAFEKCHPFINVIVMKDALKKARKGSGAFPMFAKFS